jgi:hypothetical protein
LSDSSHTLSDVASFSEGYTLSTGFFNKTGNAAKMRGDGHTPSLAGGQVFLPADTNINFMLSSSQ